VTEGRKKKELKKHSLGSFTELRRGLARGDIRGSLSGWSNRFESDLSEREGGKYLRAINESRDLTILVVQLSGGTLLNVSKRWKTINLPVRGQKRSLEGKGTEKGCENRTGQLSRRREARLFPPQLTHVVHGEEEPICGRGTPEGNGEVKSSGDRRKWLRERKTT